MPWILALPMLMRSRKHSRYRTVTHGTVRQSILCLSLVSSSSVHCKPLPSSDLDSEGLCGASFSTASQVSKFLRVKIHIRSIILAIAFSILKSTNAAQMFASDGCVCEWEKSTGEFFYPRVLGPCVCASKQVSGDDVTAGNAAHKSWGLTQGDSLVIAMMSPPATGIHTRPTALNL